MKPEVVHGDKKDIQPRVQVQAVKLVTSVMWLWPGDRPPISRTKLKLVKSVNHQQNDGHEEEQIH